MRLAAPSQPSQSRAIRSIHADRASFRIRQICRFEYIYAYSCIGPNERQDRTVATVCVSIGSYVPEERETPTECSRKTEKTVLLKYLKI